MKVGIVSCNICGNTYEKLERDINTNNKLGHHFYCSKECMIIGRRTGNTYSCSVCGKVFYREKRRVEKNTSGNIFCSHTCANSHSNRLRTGNNHPNYTNGNTSYRRLALSYYGCRCKICGYDTEECLEVHHIDHDICNCSVDNLVVLCPTHHTEIHRGIINL